MAGNSQSEENVQSSASSAGSAGGALDGGETPAAKPDGPKDPKTGCPADCETPASRATRGIAKALIAVYCIILGFMFIAAVFFYWYQQVENKPDDRWLLVFKDSFAFLAGLLATIIGYYFGNRNVDAANQNAAEARQEVKEQQAKAEVVGANTTTLLSTVSELGKQNDKINPIKPPVKSDSGLDSPVIPPASGQ